jgi:hypothetical protein
LLEERTKEVCCFEPEQSRCIKKGIKQKVAPLV